MSFTTWHNYGIGICTDEIKTQDVGRLQALLAKAPELEDKIQQWLADCGVENPTLQDYMDYDQDCCLGLATILQQVILEAEGIDMTACDNFDGCVFLIYQPQYPWELQHRETQLTEDSLAQLFYRYVSILTDDPVPVERREVENGG